MAMNPHGFNLGLNFQFGPPPRLMQQNIRVIIKESTDSLLVAIERSESLGMVAKDFAVQWRRDGLPIPGENGRVYLKRIEDQGHTIDCWVTDAFGLASEPVAIPMESAYAAS